MKKKTKNRTKALNKSFMTDYLKALFLLSFTIICAIFLFHHLGLSKLKATLLNSPENTQLQLEVLSAQAQLFYKLMIGTMMCFFVSVCILTANLTKKVSRPVEELMNHFNKIPQLSEAKKIRFKKGQTFSELFQSFNHLVQRQELQGAKLATHSYRTLPD